MSFKYHHSHRQPSERSFLMQGNDLVATSIGITANRTTLSCRMNIDAQDCLFYKSDQQKIQSLTIVQKKIKRSAFQAIQRYTHYHREITNTLFLPDALNKGNYNALSKFLEKLRNNKVGAYVKLNLQQSRGYFQKAATLLNPLSKIIQQRSREAFILLRKKMYEQREKDNKRNILDDLDRISSIQNRDSSQCSERTPVKINKNCINVSYTKVKINPQKLNNSANRRAMSSKGSHSQSKMEREPVCIDVRELLRNSKVKEYQFMNNNMSKIYYTKVNGKITRDS